MSRYRKNYLLTPGPTMIPPSVHEARAKGVPHHRTPQFMQLIKSVHEELKYLFTTKNDVYSMTSSGTGAMEAAVCSLLAPGDVAICIDGGKFGERWVELCKHFGAEAIVIHVERGDVPNPAQLEDALKKYPQAKAVFTHLTETSTGATFDVKTMGSIVAKTDAVFVVDSISGLVSEEFRMDEWHVDIAVGASHKGVMLPPGLGFLAVSEKAWKKIDATRNNSYYFDLKRYRKGHDKGEHPFTPAVDLYTQLCESMRMIHEETMEGLWKRHAWLGNATRKAVQSLGLELFAKHPCNVLTAVKVPEGIDGGKLVKTMRDDLGVSIAGGQAEMKGKIFRIAHLGYVDRFDMITAIAGLEMALKRTGYPVELGTGVKVAQDLLIDDPA